MTIVASFAILVAGVVRRLGPGVPLGIFRRAVFDLAPPRGRTWEDDAPMTRTIDHTNTLRPELVEIVPMSSARPQAFLLQRLFPREP